MRIFWTAASVIALGAATIAPAAAQRTGMHSGGTMARPMPATPQVQPMPSMPRPMPAPPQTRGNWNTQVQDRGRQWNGQVRSGGQVRQWNGGQTRSWTGGQANRGQWNGGRSRWGGRVDGRWHGGTQAPGGWNAYHRPYRGWTLPSYWYAPTFFISDYAAYGLGAPPLGYTWSRYYDDAVLVDGRGRVYDNVNGLDWDRYDGGYAYDDSDDAGYDDRYDDGGRGDRRGPPPPPGFAPPPPPIVHRGGGYETRVYTTGGHGGGYGYYGGSTTTVTVLPTTTTTTETVTYYDDVRVRRWRAPVKRKVIHRAPSKILSRSCSC
jgi:Ni/Co efflux regulator RcnB